MKIPGWQFMKLLLWIFRSETDLLWLFFFFLEWPLPKKPEAPQFQIGSGWNLARLFLTATHRLTESDFRF